MRLKCTHQTTAKALINCEPVKGGGFPGTQETNMKTDQKLKAELESFRHIWHGGYYGGNPADPVFGLWGINSFIGVSHALYLACIKPYIKPSVTVLEIGCGRGAWSKLMLGAKQVYCLDALSPEHNHFYEYVGRPRHVQYFKVEDFSLKEIPLDSIDFVFSYDALCHVSFEGISEYAASLYSRMKAGAHAFWMVADYEKYNRFLQMLDRTNVLNSLLPREKYPWIKKGLQALFGCLGRWNARRYGLKLLDLNEDAEPRPGRWYNAGTDRTCDMLRKIGFSVVDPDMGFDFRSPVIHFQR